MEVIGAIALYFIASFIYQWWKERHEDNNEITKDNVKQENEMEHTEHIETTSTVGTRDLFLETLTKIGCQYELAEEENDDRIFFAYQGEHFFASANNENRYIRIWDTYWGHVELYNVDEFARLKKAINGSNLNNSVTAVYTIDEDGKNVDVHSKSTILFVPQIPDIENYLKVELNEFFCAHRYVNLEMTKLKEQEESVNP